MSQAPPLPGPRRIGWKTVTASFGALAAFIALWTQDQGQIRTSSCDSPVYRSAAHAVGVNETLIRKLGPFSCPSSTWEATPSELTEVADNFLAAASLKPSTALRLTTGTFAKSLDPAAFAAEDGDFGFTTSWGRINWAQRLGPVDSQESNEVGFTYEVYDAPSSIDLPTDGQVRERTVRLHVRRVGTEWKVDDLVSAGRGESKDTKIYFRGSELSKNARARKLPSEESTAGVFLDEKEGRYVRMICRTNNSAPAWVRTTNGFVPVDAFSVLADLDALPECEPQHWLRAQAGRKA